jgi:hypothetical protein
MRRMPKWETGPALDPGLAVKFCAKCGIISRIVDCEIVTPGSPAIDRLCLDGMSVMGQKQTSRHVRAMSVISLKADIVSASGHVRYVPKADLSPIG